MYSGKEMLRRRALQAAVTQAYAPHGLPSLSISARASDLGKTRLRESERVQVVITEIAASAAKNLRKSSGIQMHADGFLITRRASPRSIVLRNCVITRLSIRVSVHFPPLKSYRDNLFFRHQQNRMLSFSRGNLKY